MGSRSELRRLRTLPRVSRTVTYAIELAVGLGCCAAAVPALRQRQVRWLGVVLLVAGAAAIAHAASRLAA
jgi:hypothetical protein